MKKKILFIPVLLIAVIAAPAAAAGNSPGLSPAEGLEILKKSDARLIPEICSYDLAMTTTEKQDSVKVNRFTGHKKGNQKNVMVVREPRRIAGSVHLRKDNVIWSYFTTNKRLTKMAYQAIFMGTLLNYGDVMATELSTDYDVTAAERQGPDYELTLQPKQGHEGYGKILLTIEAATLLPKKRRHYSLSGLLLKECDHALIEHDGTKTVRLKMLFYEPMKQRTTEVEFSNIKLLSDIPESYFNENQIKYLSGE